MLRETPVWSKQKLEIQLAYRTSKILIEYTFGISQIELYLTPFTIVEVASGRF